MKISVVVPAYNEEKMLPESLPAIHKALEAFHGRGWETEVVVCDNNCTDRTAEVARAHGAKVVFEPVNQISRARNGGAAGATGDWLVFVDADSFPSRALFEEVAEVIRGGKAVGGGCLLRMDYPLLVPRLIVRLWNFISLCTGWAAGSFIFCEARAFRKAGGFSTDLFVTEELDFSRKMKRVAREQGKKFQIIRKVKMVTSARKMHLYRPMEHARFMLRALFLPRRVLSSRAECHVWYDGRR